MQIFTYLLFKISHTIASFEIISTVFEVQNYRIVPKIRVDFENDIRYD